MKKKTVKAVAGIVAVVVTAIIGTAIYRARHEGTHKKERRQAHEKEDMEERHSRESRCCCCSHCSRSRRDCVQDQTSGGNPLIQSMGEQRRTETDKKKQL